MKTTRIVAALLFAALAPAFAAPAAAPLPAPIKALQAQGVQIVAPFVAAGGVKGYAGIIQQQPIAAYMTADGKHAIVGTMIDGQGRDIGQPHLDRLVSKPLTAAIWSRLDKSHWIGDGTAKAPRVIYAFTDPNCPFCNKFWKDSQPWVNAGKVQVRHVMVAILRPSSRGKAAALLAAADPRAALARHERQHGSGGVEPLKDIAPAIARRIDANNQLMNELGLAATPSIYFKDASGNLQAVQGAPDPETLRKMMGPL